MTNIKPELPGGFKDYLPGEQFKRESILNILQNTARLFGFVSIDTPAIEKEEILTAGDGSMEKQIFNIDRDDEKQQLALRFDLTVPLARFLAAYSTDVDKPFKRYQSGRVWRGEKPQAGRHREFMQFDVDIVGAPGVMAEAELLAFVSNVLDQINVGKYKIKINNRKILDQLPILASFSKDKLPDVMRAIDKLEKIGWEGIESELEDINLDSSQIKTIKSFLGLSEENSDDLLSKIKDKLESANADISGVEELEELFKHLDSLGVSSNILSIDLSIARGLGYYTGFIFETFLVDSDIGSIFSGGRYDDLMETFSGSPMPAVGASIGIDRLMSVIEIDDNPIADVLVLNFDDQSHDYCLNIVNDLRESGIKSEIYLGQEDTLKGQLSYGVKRNFPVVIIAGSQEKNKDIVQLKDISKKEQNEINRSDLVKSTKDILEN